MKNKAVVDLSELREKISAARKASSAMLTFALLFDIASVAAETDSGLRELFPSLGAISSLCEDLAVVNEDALGRVEWTLNKIDTTQSI